MRRWLALVLVSSFLVGGGLAAAQDKPAQEQKKEKAAAADPLSGNWEGSVETPNGTITFGLKVKVEGDKVSGEIASPEGAVPLSGTWTEGKLNATFDYNGTPISMTGAVKEEVLSGEMSYGGGQAIMAYTAKRAAAK